MKKYTQLWEKLLLNKTSLNDILKSSNFAMTGNSAEHSKINLIQPKFFLYHQYFKGSIMPCTKGDHPSHVYSLTISPIWQ